MTSDTLLTPPFRSIVSLLMSINSNFDFQSPCSFHRMTCNKKPLPKPGGAGKPQDQENGIRAERRNGHGDIPAEHDLAGSRDALFAFGRIIRIPMRPCPTNAGRDKDAESMRYYLNREHWTRELRWPVGGERGGGNGEAGKLHEGVDEPDSQGGARLLAEPLV